MDEDSRAQSALGRGQRAKDRAARPSGHLLKALAVAGVALIIAISIEVRYGAPVRPDLELQLGSPEPVPRTATDPGLNNGFHTVRFAVAPVLSPTATARDFSSLAQYLAANIGRPVTLILGKSYAEINALVRQREVSLALVCSGAYVLGKREFGMQALVAPVVKGKKSYQSYIITQSQGPERSWSDLRNKTFAFTDPLSNSGRLAPAYLLARNGFTPGSFFRSVMFTYNHDRSVEAVAKGLVGGAAVNNIVYDGMIRADPSVAARTRVIWKSDNYGINPIVVAPGLDPALRRRFERAFLEMNLGEPGRRILKQLGADRFELPDLKSYDSIEEMVHSLGAL